MRKFTARSRKNRFQMLNAAKEFLKRAFHHDGVRRYGANTLWLMAEKVIRLVIGFSVGIYVARSLGPAQYGLLNYAISFVALFSILISLGLDAIVVRELVKTPERRDELLGSACGLKSIGFVLMAGCIGMAVWLMPVALSEKVLFLIICGGYAFQAFQVIDLYFQSRVQSKYVAISQIVVLLLASVLRLLFSYQAAPLWCFAMVEAGYMAGVVIAYAFFYLRSGLKIADWHFDRATVSFLLQESWPLLFASAAGMIYTRFDQILITWLLGEAANGQYAVAVRLTEVFFLLPIVIGDSLFPSIVGVRPFSRLRYYRRVCLFLCGLFYLAVFVSLPFLIGGKFLILQLYGEAYREGAGLFQLFMIKNLAVFPALALGKWYLAERMQRLSLFISICGALTNIALLWWLLQWLGGAGAVWASFFTSIGNLLIWPLFSRKGRLGVRLMAEALILPFSRRRCGWLRQKI